MTHPLLDVMLSAAAGRHPRVDGGVTFLPELDGGHRAVVAFTGRAFVLTSQDADQFADLALDGFGGALAPDVLLRLADGGTIDDHDAMLVAVARPMEVSIVRTERWDHHARVLYARRFRSNVEVFGDERGFITIADGLAGRREVSIEVTDPGAEVGAGRHLLEQARALVDDEHLFAAVSPGNARSLRSFLAAGFKPLGSQVLIDRGASTDAVLGSSDELGS